MGNPFDDLEGTFVVLVNAAGQHSLWPSFIPEPPGWDIVHGPSGRTACLDFIDAGWRDLRPQVGAEAGIDPTP